MFRPHGPAALVAARVAIALAFIAGGCAPRTESDLLEIRHVGPERIEAVSRLQVRGTGFPPGRGAHLRLEGRLHRPGERPRQVRVQLEGRALSGELLEGDLTESALETLGRGTLHGQLTVAFEAAGEGTVVGRSPPLVLDVTPPSADRLGATLDHRRRAVELAESLGLTLGEEDPAAGGLPIEEVGEGSPAARSGLVAGDRLVALDGLRLHSLSDLVPSPDAEAAGLEVARLEEASTFEVSLPLPRQEHALSPAVLRLGQAALAWVLLVALLLAPTASMTDWMLRPAAAGRRRSAWVLRLLLGGAFFSSIVALARAHLLHVPLEVVVVSTLGARAAAAHLGARPGEGAWRRLVALGGALGASVLAAVAVSAVGAAGGTTDLMALHDQQGAAPWEWAAFRSPAGPLVVALVIAAGAFGPRLGGLSHRVASAVEETVALALAAVLASVLLGGWTVPAHAGWAWTALGPALFVLKGLVCWAAMRRAATMGSRWLAHGGAVVLAGASAAVWIAWEPPLAVEQALAEVLTAVAAVLAVWLLYRRLVDDHQAAPTPTHPFL